MLPESALAILGRCLADYYVPKFLHGVGHNIYGYTGHLGHDFSRSDFTG